MTNPREMAEKAFGLLQEALRDSEARANALDAELKQKPPSKSDMELHLKELTERLEAAQTQNEGWKDEARQLEEVLRNERAKLAQLRKKLEIAEAGPEKLTKKEINFWRAKAEKFNNDRGEYKARIASLKKELQAREGEVGDLSEQLNEASAGLQEATQRAAALEAGEQTLRSELEERSHARARLDRQLATVEAELESRAVEARGAASELERARQIVAERDNRITLLSGQLEQAQTRNRQLEKERLEARERAESTESAQRHLEESVELLQQTLAQKDRELSQLVTRQAELESRAAEARNHAIGLEASLKDEKLCTENLSEVANERREQIIKLEEQVEEAEERYADACWRLGKAQHFERLVRRRKRLIRSLLSALRVKYKANTALKAGLDSLRTHKAAAEANQDKLLRRIDKLTANLREAEETSRRNQSAPSDELGDAPRVEDLEARLNTQAELIQSLEEELKTAKALGRDRHQHTEQIEALQRELDRKNGIIAQLESDVDEQQRRLAKLRGSDSETVRLRAIREQDMDSIRALEREVAELHDSIARQAGGDQQALTEDLLKRERELGDKLKEKDETITRLLVSIKEQETKLAEMTETAKNWQKKYEFMSTEAPGAYQAVAEK
jgi:chromosome segregation ATPase